MRAAVALSRFYVRIALLNPVSWIALCGSLFATWIASDILATSLAHEGIELGLIELVVHVSGDPNYTTWGLFACFTFIVSPMLYARNHERLIAHRAGGRTELWIAKLMAVVQLAVPFLGVAVLLSTVLVASAAEPSSPGRWSDGYAEAARMVASALEAPFDQRGQVLTATDRYHMLANVYLFETATPLSVALMQVVVFTLALSLVGVLCAVLAQVVKSQAVTLIAVMVYLVSPLVSPAVVPPAARFAAPQGHVYTLYRSAEFPYTDSLVFLASSLVALTVLGWLQSRRTFLG